MIMKTPGGGRRTPSPDNPDIDTAGGSPDFIPYAFVPLDVAAGRLRFDRSHPPLARPPALERRSGERDRDRDLLNSTLYLG